MSGFDPDNVNPPGVLQAQSPCCEGHTATTLEAAVEVALFSQTMVPSQS